MNDAVVTAVDVESTLMLPFHFKSVAKHTMNAQSVTNLIKFY